MKLKLISWDVRGLSNVDTRGELKTLLRIWKPGIACFQEDKIKGWNRRRLVKEIWGNNHFDWVPFGRSGGVGFENGSGR